VVVALLAIAAPTGSPPVSGQSVEGPPPAYVFVVDEEIREPAQLLKRIRESLIRAVSEAGLTSAGYPRPCHIKREPHPSRPNAYSVSCVERDGELTQPDGILFGPEGHYLQLSIVDFADSRAYLTRVLLVSGLSHPPLGSETGMTIPRVVLHLPHIPDSWHPAVWQVLEGGIEATGATRPISDDPDVPDL
jgi:hypothetical protein